MGGYLSGRHGGGPTVEDGWKLDLAHCIRQGMLRPGQWCAGTMKWSLVRTGEVTATIRRVKAAKHVRSTLGLDAPREPAGSLLIEARRVGASGR